MIYVIVDGYEMKIVALRVDEDVWNKLRMKYRKNLHEEIRKKMLELL